MLKGELRVRYTDGSEETVEAGQSYYFPAGDTVWFEEDTEHVEFSPQQETTEVFVHVEEQMQASRASSPDDAPEKTTRQKRRRAGKGSSTWR